MIFLHPSICQEIMVLMIQFCLSVKSIYCISESGSERFSLTELINNNNNKKKNLPVSLCCSPTISGNGLYTVSMETRKNNLAKLKRTLAQKRDCQAYFDMLLSTGQDGCHILYMPKNKNKEGRLLLKNIT